MTRCYATFERDDGTEIEVSADVRVHGARLYGPPEDCYPGEVEIENFKAVDEDGAPVELTDAENEKADELLLEAAEDR